MHVMSIIVRLETEKGRLVKEKWCYQFHQKTWLVAKANQQRKRYVRNFIIFRVEAHYINDCLILQEKKGLPCGSEMLLLSPKDLICSPHPQPEHQVQRTVTFSSFFSKNERKDARPFFQVVRGCDFSIVTYQ